MTDARTPKPHPAVWNVVKNIMLSAWIYIAICSLIYAVVLSGLHIAAFMLAIIFTLFIGGIITLIFSSLIIAPLLFFRDYPLSTYRVLTIATCSLAAAGLAAVFVYILPMDYSGKIMGTSKPGALILIIGTALGTLSAWTGLWFTEKVRTS